MAVLLYKEPMDPGVPASTNIKLYARNDGNVYTLDSTGTRRQLGAKGDKGDTGAAGSQWLCGNGVPSGSIGNTSDMYLDNLTGNVYQKFAVGGWLLQCNTAPSGAYLKLDGTSTTTASIPFAQGLSSAGLISSSVAGKAIQLADGAWIGTAAAGQSVYLSNGVNPAAYNSVLQLTSSMALLSFGNGSSTQYGYVQLSPGAIQLNQIGGGAISVGATGSWLATSTITIQSSSSTVSLTGVNLVLSSTNTLQYFGTTHQWDGGIGGSTAKYQFQGSGEFAGTLQLSKAGGTSSPSLYIASQYASITGNQSLYFGTGGASGGGGSNRYSGINMQHSGVGGPGVTVYAGDGTLNVGSVAITGTNAAPVFTLSLPGVSKSLIIDNTGVHTSNLIPSGTPAASGWLGLDASGNLVSSAAASSNPFNQSLNTTDSPTFTAMTLSGSIVIGGSATIGGLTLSGAISSSNTTDIVVNTMASGSYQNSGGMSNAKSVQIGGSLYLNNGGVALTAASNSQLYSTITWNGSAVVMNPIWLIDLTNTLSASGSTIAQIKIGGSNALSLTTTGVNAAAASTRLTTAGQIFAGGSLTANSSTDITPNTFTAGTGAFVSIGGGSVAKQFQVGTKLLLNNAANAITTTGTNVLSSTITWNGSSVVMDPLWLMNVTNTLSGAGSKFFDFQLGGSSVLNLATSAANATAVTATTLTAGGAMVAKQFGQGVQTAAYSATLSWDLSLGGLYRVSTQMGGALTMNLSNPLAGASSWLIVTQFTTPSTITLSLTGVTFLLHGTTTSSTNTLVIPTTSIPTINAYYAIELIWISTTACVVKI